MNIIQLNKLTKFFGQNKNITALKNVTLDIRDKSFTVILGRSGSGKSTLLNIIAGLEKASEGDVLVANLNLEKLSQSGLAKYRSEVGIIFQNYNLLPDLTVLENIMMGAWAAGNSKIQKAEAENILSKIGLSHRVNANIKTLSGGEKQRVAIARALINSPKILFCDEPTGALDTVNEKEVMNILKDLQENQGITVVIVTHNPEFQDLATQIVTMKDGEIIENKLK